MSFSVISVEHLSKQYDLGVVGTGTLARDFERWWAKVRGKPDPFSVVGSHQPRKNAGDSILALDDVSFTVQQGEALGIIGRNGAGKSTLLKILSRVTAPTSGVIKVKGRIGSLLEVGTGFHGELTGRENVYLNGAIFGMNKAEVARKFDEIVAFSGVEKFIDTPVKRYSSGMYVRLGFAVAAHLDPDILIVDEVLAVGDAEFQKKCLGKMGDVAGEGRTILFVSHNMVSMRNLCAKTILLKDGIIVNEGPTDEIISEYQHVYQKPNEFNANEKQRLGDHRIRILNFSIEPSIPVTGEPLTCRVDVENVGNTSVTADFSISFTSEDGSKVFQMHSGHIQNGISIKSGLSHISSSIESLYLAPGKYGVNLWIGSGKMIFDWVPESYSFEVKSGTFEDGIFVDARGYPVIMPSKWNVNENN